MDYLKATDSLHIDLEEAISTLEIHYFVSYHDFDSDGIVLPPLNGVGQSSGTTRKEIIAVGSNTRQVTQLNLYNPDGIDHNVLIQLNDGSSFYSLGIINIPSGSTACWNRSLGWVLAPVAIQAGVVLTPFVASDTWTKPAGLKRALIVCVGAGAGGGSGCRGAAGTNRFGGGGGGGGAIGWLNLGESELSVTVAVTIGAGGAGGTAITVDTTNGNIGTAGGDTSFGATLIAKGGSGGGGGTSIAGALGSGGSVSTGNPQFGPFILPGANGAAGNTITTSAGATGLIGTTGAAGGGGGGGINAANTSGTAAMTGGAVYQNGILQVGPVSGASPNGVAGQSMFLLLSRTLSSGHGLGTGGAGGVPAFVNGGNGGNYGAGGGGGSGVLNGGNSGAGGNGAGGLCIVMEIF